MAKNFVQEGNILTLTAPSGGILSGKGMLSGDIFGVALSDADEGEDVECALTGVWTLAKVGGQAWVQGDPIYWDNTAKACSTNNAVGRCIGVATAAVGSGVGVVTGNVRLNGVFGLASIDELNEYISTV